MANLRCSGCHTDLDDHVLVCRSCGFPAEPAPPDPSAGGDVRKRHHEGSASDGSSDSLDSTVATASTGTATLAGAPHSDVTVLCRHEGARTGAVLCPTCGAALVRPAEVTDDDGRGAPDADVPPRPHAVIRLPWNADILLRPGESVEVGREVGPMAERLSGTVTVSRRHATLAMTPSGMVTVADHASTNGTFVNGSRCPSTGTIEVPDGAQVSFSSSFAVRVEVLR